MTRTLFWDGESNLVLPGLAIPELICVQWSYDDAAPQIRSHVEDWRSVLHEALYDPDVIFCAHNGSFDLALIAEAEPDFVQPVFRMLANKRARDTMIAETLISIRDGDLDIRSKQKGSFALGTLSQRYLNIPMAKGQDSWRLRYATLKGLPASEYPDEAKQYCHEDVTCLRGVHRGQTYSSPDEWMQCAAAFALHLAQAWGVRTDGEALEKLEKEVLEDAAMCERVLVEAGMFSDGSVNRKAVQDAVVKACEALGREVPRTKPTAKQIEKWKAGKLAEEPIGSVKYDAATTEALKEAEPRLKRLSQHTTAAGDFSKYVVPMKGGLHAPMNSRPNVLVATGRTSWAGSKSTLQNPWEPLEKPIEVTVGCNLQQITKRPGVRECFVPRPGYWYCSVDYSTLELRTFAQAALWIVGHSTFADGFNADLEWDPHTWMAGKLSGLTYEEAMAKKEAKDAVIKNLRNCGKALNFSLIGGVGAKKLQVMAEAAPYYVKMTLDESYAARELWYDTVTEAPPYFEYVNYVINSGKPQRMFVSGMLRGNVGYTDCANGYFQSLGALASKRALYAVSQACYAEPKSPLFGSRPVVFVHDEIILEVPIDRAHEASMEVCRLMDRELSSVCPDIPPKSEPTLMTRWIKKAEPKWTADGKLTAWDLP